MFFRWLLVEESRLSRGARERRSVETIRILVSATKG